MITDFETYLKELSIPDDDKRYASSFFRKEEYLESITSTAINLSGARIHSGKGNPNSKIMICIDNFEHETTVRKFITPLFERINLSIWNCYLTFKNKTEIDSINKQMLASELSCIKPVKIIEFDVGPTNFNEIPFGNNGQKINISMGDIEYILDKNNFQDEFYVSFMNNIYKYMITLIPFKELEIEK